MLAYRSTPVDAHLQSPAEMLYQRVIQTTMPQRIRNKDPHAELDQERLNDRATLSASYHDCHSRTKSPFYAGQTVSVLNDAKTFWLPATVIRQADHGSYLVEVIGGGRYRRARDHICERHPEAEPMRKDSCSPGNVAPATPEWPGAPPVQKPLTVQKSPPVPKSPPVQKAPVAPTTTTSPSTGAPQQTGAAPAAPHRSAFTRKPPTRLITEM